VMPTTGASPFLTNSYRPVKNIVSSCLHIIYIAWEVTRHFVCCQPECIAGNLLVYIPFHLKNDLAHCNSGGPIIKGSFPFTHTDLGELVPGHEREVVPTYLISTAIHSNICTNSLI
jgi:hypothetical protein